MRKDKTSMKSILLEARALRTASLSGQKKTETYFHKPRQTYENSDFSNSMSPQTQTQATKALGNPGYLNSGFSQFSQQFSQAEPATYEARYHMEPPASHYRQQERQHQHSLRLMQEQIEANKRILEETRKKIAEQKCIDLLRKINEELQGKGKQPTRLTESKRELQKKLSEMEKFSLNITQLIM